MCYDYYAFARFYCGDDGLVPEWKDAVNGQLKALWVVIKGGTYVLGKRDWSMSLYFLSNLGCLWSF